MMIEATKLINLPVGAEDTRRKIGHIRQIVVDPKTDRLMGFLISVGMLNAPKVLSQMDVKFWDENGLVTEREKNLVEQSEIVRLKNVLDKDINLLQMPAKTESGKSLGMVENFLIDTETGSVVKYYLKDMLGKTRIMPSDKVVSIDKVIIFQDDIAEIPDGLTETSLA